MVIKEVKFMMLKCDICGCEFDHTQSGDCDCGMGCGGQNVKCPQCGLHLILPPELRKIKEKEENSKSMLDKLAEELGVQ